MYFNACAELETIGPSWYRLEVIGSMKTLGSFTAPEPERRSGAIFVDNVRQLKIVLEVPACMHALLMQGLEFTAGKEPLILWDLPRTYKWSTLNHQPPPSNPCFRYILPA